MRKETRRAATAFAQEVLSEISGADEALVAAVVIMCDDDVWKAEPNPAPRRLSAWTDGSCSTDTKRGGYAVVLMDEAGNVTEASGFQKDTTINAMKITAAIVALRLTSVGDEIVIHTDSRYLADGFALSGRWAERGWRKSSGQIVANVTLWKELRRLSFGKTVSFVLVNGHDGDPLNERADRLAGSARQRT